MANDYHLLLVASFCFSNANYPFSEFPNMINITTRNPQQLFSRHTFLEVFHFYSKPGQTNVPKKTLASSLLVRIDLIKVLPFPTNTTLQILLSHHCYSCNCHYKAEQGEVFGAQKWSQTKCCTRNTNLCGGGDSRNSFWMKCPPPALKTLAGISALLWYFL